MTDLKGIIESEKELTFLKDYAKVCRKHKMCISFSFGDYLYSDPELLICSLEKKETMAALIKEGDIKDVSCIPSSYFKGKDKNLMNWKNLE